MVTVAVWSVHGEVVFLVVRVVKGSLHLVLRSGVCVRVWKGSIAGRHRGKPNGMREKNRGIW